MSSTVYGTKVAFETLREATPAQIGATYAAVGAALAHNCRLLNLQNASDGDVYISFDGTNNHVHLAAVSSGNAAQRQYNFQENAVANQLFGMAKGVTIYAKDGTTPPANGNLIIEVVYAS